MGLKTQSKRWQKPEFDSQIGHTCDTHCEYALSNLSLSLFSSLHLSPHSLSRPYKLLQLHAHANAYLLHVANEHFSFLASSSEASCASAGAHTSTRTRNALSLLCISVTTLKWGRHCANGRLRVRAHTTRIDSEQHDIKIMPNARKRMNEKEKTGFSILIARCNRDAFNGELELETNWETLSETHLSDDCRRNIVEHEHNRTMNGGRMDSSVG